MLSELLIGAVTNFFTAGSNRVVNRLSDAYITNNEIKKIILQTAPTSDVSEGAEAILARAIGNSLGIYDEKIAGIINNAAVNGYSDALFNISLSERHKSKEIKERFCNEYKDDFKPLQISADVFFDALQFAVDKIALQKFGDKQTALLIAETRSEICQKLESFCKTGGVEYPKSRLDEFSLRFSKFTQAQNKDVAIETDRGQKKIPIDKIFVKSRLLGTKGDEITSGLIDPRKFRNNEQIIKYVTFARTLKRTCVIGNPGGGKSTLCQYICFDFAKKYILLAKNPNRNNHDLALAKLPIKVTMRNFKKSHERDGYGFVEYIVSEIRSKLEDDYDFIRSWLLATIGAGKAIILFDGLDEILDVSDRRIYVELIEAFVHEWPTCPYLCTSRKVGYLKAPLSDRFQIFELAPFDDEEILSYATGATKIIRNINTDEAQTLSIEFIKQTSKNANDLRSNPLMLGLMVWLYLTKGHVPRNRAAIYAECALLMFEKWDPNRGIIAPIPDDFNMVELFGYLATEILGDRDAEAGVSANWIEAKILKFLTQWYESPSKATSSARKIKEFVTGRSWVMTDIGADLYGFTHRTFLEYFYAVHLDKKFETIDELLDNLTPSILDSSLDVISHLSIQRKCENNRARSSKFIHIIVSLFSDVELTESTANAIKFLGSSMEYMSVGETDIRFASTAIVRSIVGATGYTAYESAKEGFNDWLSNTHTKSDINYEVYKRALSYAISTKDKDVIYKSLDLMGVMTFPHMKATAFMLFFEKLSDIIDRAAEKDIFIARILIDLDSKRIHKYRKIHGEAILLLSARRGDIVRIPPLFYLNIWEWSFRSPGGQKRQPNFSDILADAFQSRSSLEIPIYSSLYLPDFNLIDERLMNILGHEIVATPLVEQFVAATVELLIIDQPDQFYSRYRNPVTDRLIESSIEVSETFKEWMHGEFDLFSPGWR